MPGPVTAASGCSRSCARGPRSAATPGDGTPAAGGVFGAGRPPGSGRREAAVAERVRAGAGGSADGGPRGGGFLPREVGCLIGQVPPPPPAPPGQQEQCRGGAPQLAPPVPPVRRVRRLRR